MAYEDLYGRLMEAAPLGDKHREALVTGRGFSQDTIRRFRFGSGGPHLLAFEEEWMKGAAAGKVQERDLVGSGAFIHDGKILRLNPMLLNDFNSIDGKTIPNILIPYLSGKGDVYYVRPHKLGFSGLPSEIYQDLNLAGDPDEIILTEGEFKAAAGMQYGFPTISVPGISSFSEKKFPELVKLLNAHKVKRVIIMFDNETKSDPAFPGRYKDNPHDRYDTQFYAYYMATKLEQEGKEVLIAVLPEGWKADGKIDIDGCAAQLRTAGEMKKIIYDAKSRNEYLGGLELEAKQQVLRKNNQKYHKSKVKKEFNRYVVTRHRGKNAWDEPISNFVMRVVATHDTPEGMKREIELINEFGKRSGAFTIAPADMASSEGFRTFCLSRGDFIWRGTIEDLLTIWEDEFLMMDEGRYIVENDHVGWVDREKLWLFGNVAITAAGDELRPDKNGIFWLEKRGIKPVPITVTAGKMAAPEGIPYLSLQPFDIGEMRIRLSETIGRNETSVVLGWVTATVFMEEIFATYRSFPFLFITGRWRSGKSTIAEWIMSFFGIENAGKSISQTTPVAIQRSLSYYSCLPVYLDEYRNTRDIKYKDGFLRNVYNRQGAGKGIKDSDYALRDAKIRGTLILAGEETPKDGGTLSRCIVIFISKANRQKNHFQWFMQNRARFSGHYLSLLRGKGKLLTKYFESILEWREFFTGGGIDDRMALNYATVVAGHEAVFGDRDVEFANWMTAETKTVQGEQSEEQAVNLFIDDLMALKTAGKVDDSYWTVTNGAIYLYFHGLHQVWSEQFRKTRGDEAFKEASIRAYLKEENGFMESNVKWTIKGQGKKCIKFDMANAPDDLRELVSG